MKEPINPEVAIFNGALELAGAERAAYLDQACAGNMALREKVEALLKASEQAENFLEVPPTGLPRTITVRIPLTEKPGDKIGRYKLLQQIGEGGCGVVYMAEQEEPVRRRVALKVIKLGMDTKEVIARFEAERQALAMMDHPNIAKVLDAGATDTGRPYFVMELVRGIKITEYCDENKVPTEERLKLFVQVCQAIQHAHQKGIIHRDIKPSNILVTINDGVPVPKVIDFGIAKATQGRLTDSTLFTAFEQFLGTPAYMSPEQTAMTSVDIDTRSDIYSLGVLLYELLTGKTPFDASELLQSGLDAMRRTIREKEPPKPSTRLSTMLNADRTVTASHRQTDPPKLIHLVRGDLDWIVMKSLEKDRARRYETANGFAADIQKHLNDEPVSASPPGGFYRLQKAMRRNKRTYAAMAAIMCALTVGLGVSTWVSNLSQSIRRRGAVECLGLTLINPTESLLKRHQLPTGIEYRGPIVTQVQDGHSAFRIPPKPDCMFWIVEHPMSINCEWSRKGEFPSYRPKTVRQMIQAILSSACTPQQFQRLWAQALREMADKFPGQRQLNLRVADALDAILSSSNNAVQSQTRWTEAIRAMADETPSRREDILKYAFSEPFGDETAKYICRVVYHYPTNAGTMTTHLSLTEKDVDTLRELLKRLPPD